MTDRTDECYPEYDLPPYVLTGYVSLLPDGPPSPPDNPPSPPDSPPPPYSPPVYATVGMTAPYAEPPALQALSIKDDREAPFDELRIEMTDIEALGIVYGEEAANAKAGSTFHSDNDSDYSGGDEDRNQDGNQGNDKGTGIAHTRHPHREHRECCAFSDPDQNCEIYFDLTHNVAWVSNENKKKTCCICLENLVPDEETLTHNKCHVEFHEECLTHWLGTNPNVTYDEDGKVQRPSNCPNCRGEIPARAWVSRLIKQVNQRGKMIRQLTLTNARQLGELMHKDSRHVLVVEKLNRAKGKILDLEFDLELERFDHLRLKKKFEELVISLNAALRMNVLQMNMPGAWPEDNHEDYEEENEEDD